MREYFGIGARTVSVRVGRLASLVLLSWGIAGAQVSDFTLTVTGPVNVVRGHYMFLGLKGTVTAGTDTELVTPSISGLPAGATAHFINMEKLCCQNKIWRIESDNPIRIDTLKTTPYGTYPLTIRYQTDSGLVRTTTYTITVGQEPVAVSGPKRYPADVALSALETWQKQMLSFGKFHCTTAELAIWEGNVWYYDGERVYYQIADYTQDPFWNTCAQLEEGLYRDYVITNNGGLPGWRIFAKGLAMDYQRTGDPLSKTAVDLLSSNIWASGQNVQWCVDWTMSREMSYAIDTHLARQSIGTPITNPWFNDLIEILLGHFDQWFVSRKARYVQPIMVALAAEALISYYDYSQDPRVPQLLKLAADEIWRNSWDAGSQSLRYYNDDGTASLAPDTNLLIVPLYGWVYRMTGDSTYRTMGDQIFAGGVAGAWLAGGKQFSQNYRWSGKYVGWRNAPSKKSTSIFTESATAPSTASFVQTDSATEGDWPLKFGLDGYNVAGDQASYPAYVSPTPSVSGQYSPLTWVSSTSDVRGLKKPSNLPDRIGAAWSSPSSFTIDLNTVDMTTHPVALYCLDYDSKARRQVIDVLDSQGNVLDSRTVSNFQGGIYLVWKVSGHVSFRVTLLNGPTAVVNGVFLGDPKSPSVPAPVIGFVKADTFTQGNWRSKYGAEGYELIGDATLMPAYGSVTPSGLFYLFYWGFTTVDPRALQEPDNSTNRIFSAWYAPTTFVIDVNLTDTAIHQVALYCLDVDTSDRRQTVELLDANDVVVAKQNLSSSFHDGVYLIWNLSGHMKFRVTATGGFNAVVNGIFFR